MTNKPETTKRRKQTKPTTELVYLERMLLNQIEIMTFTCPASLRGHCDMAVSETEKTLRGEYDV